MDMNKVIKSILFGIAFFPLTGCLSNLDLHPIDSDTPNTFFKDSALRKGFSGLL